MDLGDVIMGAMSEMYASRMRGPEPDEGDLWVLDMAKVMRAKRERHTRRLEVVIEALRHSAAIDTVDDEEVFL